MRPPAAVAAVVPVEQAAIPRPAAVAVEAPNQQTMRVAGEEAAAERPATNTDVDVDDNAPLITHVSSADPPDIPSTSGVRNSEEPIASIYDVISQFSQKIMKVLRAPLKAIRIKKNTSNGLRATHCKDASAGGDSTTGSNSELDAAEILVETPLSEQPGHRNETASCPTPTPCTPATASADCVLPQPRLTST